ncbi:hypothetical protein DQ244_17210 [Blastococcus sp. TBT05-19]|uniref:hypothetical protein n=1 Tax=Blastococcus sp. TBT05-19 TaxID=2250581 RepID=UPI000DE8E662|nr:hypothetical protein [Blastococcus sp. TBT05-19]RBY87078.1 hypothetical protein DQ244_17210 [Blastococcus sp. TBT05-19]
MSVFERLTVDLYTDDPMLLSFLEPDERPDEVTVPTDISLTPHEAALVHALPPGEKASVLVIDWLEERALVVMAEAPGEYVAALHHEATEELARRLRA